VDGKELTENYINGTTLSGGAHAFPVTIPPGYVFVMGDNRMNSTDSRSAEVKFVPEEDVLGKVVFRIFPFNSIGNPAA
jgi:signal peptidase I